LSSIITATGRRFPTEGSAGNPSRLVKGACVGVGPAVGVAVGVGVTVGDGVRVGVRVAVAAAGSGSTLGGAVVEGAEAQALTRSAATMNRT
jgi:hypothetical protein